MAETTLTFGDVTPDDLDAVRDIQVRSFGPIPGQYEDLYRQRTSDLIASRRLVGVRAGDRLVAQARIRPFRQYWGGRALPMAGIASVGVAPDYRGRGVGSILMRGVVQRGIELGDIVSALYPATVPLYRRLGWELAGVQHRISVDAAALRRIGPADIEVRPAVESDADAVLDHVRRHWTATRANGPKALEADQVRRELADPGTFCYRSDDGLLAYTWDDHDLLVHHLTAGSAGSARALWALVGSSSSVARTVHAYVDPRDPLPLLLDGQVASSVKQERWMLRLLDAPAAIAGRGYPASAEVDVAITIDDPLAEQNSGSWRLRIGAGSGSLERSAESTDALCLGPNGLAALYAGTPLATLRLAGLAEGGRPTDDAALDAAFAATPFMLEYF